jgi:hypothetical protein
MIKEISANRIEEYAGHFQGPQLEMVLASVADENSKAQLWMAIQAANNVVGLLWDKGNNVFYLSGNLISEDTTNEFAALIKTEVKARAIKEGLSHFKVHALSDSFENSITRLFQGLTLDKTIKLFYTFRKPKVNAIPAPALENVQFVLIEADFLEKDFQNLEYVKSEIKWMWPSPERFCEKGFGFAALLEERIICWCTAEYVSQNKCGIGIETIREFENKGIATSTTAHFVEYCLSHHISPYWECGGDNIGSIRVAEKVGFERIQEAIFWAGIFQR